MRQNRVTLAVQELLFSVIGEISPRAFQLGMVLGTYANGSGQCYPSVSTLAQRLGVTERTISTAIGELEQSGILTRRRRGNGYLFSFAIAQAEDSRQATRRILPSDQKISSDQVYIHGINQRTTTTKPQGATATGIALPVVVASEEIEQVAAAAAALQPARSRSVSAAEIIKAMQRAPETEPLRAAAAIISALADPKIRSPLSAASWYIPTQETIKALKRQTFTANKPVFSEQIDQESMPSQQEIDRIKSKMYRRLGIKTQGAGAQ